MLATVWPWLKCFRTPALKKGTSNLSLLSLRIWHYRADFNWTIWKSKAAHSIKTVIIRTSHEVAEQQLSKWFNNHGLWVRTENPQKFFAMYYVRICSTKNDLPWRITDLLYLITQKYMSNKFENFIKNFNKGFTNHGIRNLSSESLIRIT